MSGDTTQLCPYCGAEVHTLAQATAACARCGARKMGPCIAIVALSEWEVKTGWYAPGRSGCPAAEPGPGLPAEETLPDLCDRGERERLEELVWVAADYLSRASSADGSGHRDWARQLIRWCRHGGWHGKIDRAAVERRAHGTERGHEDGDMGNAAGAAGRPGRLA